MTINIIMSKEAADAIEVVAVCIMLAIIFAALFRREV